MTVVHLDFESRSTVDLKAAGLHVYADPRFTEITVCAWAFDDDPVEAINLHEWDNPHFDRLLEHIRSGGIVYAHNAIFERIMWNKVFVRQFFIPQIKAEQMQCTAAMAYSMGLPGSLERSAAALGLDMQKDMEGSRLMMAMCKPLSIDEKDVPTWRESLEDVARLTKYCVQDVIVERELTKRLLHLSPYEQKVWILDQKINDAGICVDRKAAIQAIKIVETEQQNLNKKIQALTDNNVATVTAVQQIKDYLDFFGVDNESISKSDVTELLASDDLHPHAREVLMLRAQGGKAATAKLKPMIEGTTDDDPRLRGCFQYSGANTRRWAGRRVQLHNLKRPSIKQAEIENIFEALNQGLGADYLDLNHGPPLSVIADCTRGFLVAPDGRKLLACDFSAIEARVLAWLAGQDDVLKTFASGEDVYLKQASDIFSKPIVDKEDPRRMIGKVSILALGYQGGVGALQTMCRAYNVKMAPAFNDLWKTIDENTQKFCEQRYQENKKDLLISREEWLASEVTKIKWRRSNEKIVQFWADIEEAFKDAILKPGTTISVGNANRQLKFKKSGSFLFCRLPGGGAISYPYPEIQETKTPWGAKKMLPSYMSEDAQNGHKWKRFSTYGGSVCENITQAVARDLLADAMLRLDGTGFKIVAHVHDEIICETVNDHQKLETMREIMSTPPSWAHDLPLASSGWAGARYRK